MSAERERERVSARIIVVEYLLIRSFHSGTLQFSADGLPIIRSFRQLLDSLILSDVVSTCHAALGMEYPS